jgi:acetate kinase
MVIAHLGGGCSVTALLDGYSVDTTMGLTPTGGVVMETRPGDLDPGLILYLLRQQKDEGRKGLSAVETILNRESGMSALAGMAGDVKALRQAAAKGDEQAALALKIFTRQNSVQRAADFLATGTAFTQAGMKSCSMENSSPAFRTSAIGIRSSTPPCWNTRS